MLSSEGARASVVSSIRRFLHLDPKADVSNKKLVTLHYVVEILARLPTVFLYSIYLRLRAETYAFLIFFTLSWRESVCTYVTDVCQCRVPLNAEWTATCLSGTVRASTQLRQAKIWREALHFLVCGGHCSDAASSAMPCTQVPGAYSSTCLSGVPFFSGRPCVVCVACTRKPLAV